MKLKDLLEIELGKDPEHEKIISQREKALEKKIVKKEKSKVKTLRKIENMADELVITDHEKFVDKYGKEAGNDVLEFLTFSLIKLKEYAKDEEGLEIPMSAIPSAQGVILNTMITSLNKIERKLVGEIIKKEKPKNTTEFLSVLNMSQEEMYNKLDGKIPGLDIKDLEEFVNKVSKDPGLKKRINRINKSISNLYSIYAKNKHLSSVGSGKKIEL